MGTVEELGRVGGREVYYILIVLGFTFFVILVFIVFEVVFRGFIIYFVVYYRLF